MNALLTDSRRILAVEDDPLLAGYLDQHLRRRGFEVTLRHGIDDSDDLGNWQAFDLVLMDILLPGRNGITLLGQLRQQSSVPVILMSALGAEQDRILGFSQGADDYLPKPFSLVELDARIDALFRRVAYERHAPPRPPLNDQGLQPDEWRQDYRFNDRWAGFTPAEFRLMETFLADAGEVLSKPFLYQQVLRRPFSQQDRVLDMHVSHLRRKLAAIGYEGRINTVWGRGYVLSEADA